MKQALSFMLILTASFPLLSCDEDNDNFLRGSVKDTNNISFKGVRARLYTSELSIEYYTDKKEGEVALRVALDVNAGLKAGKTYDLMKHGTVSRDEGFGGLPEMISGELTLDKYGSKVGSTVEGSFTAKFVTTSGSEQALRGGFSSELEIPPI